MAHNWKVQPTLCMGQASLWVAHLKLNKRKEKEMWNQIRYINYSPQNKNGNEIIKAILNSLIGILHIDEIA